MNKTIWMIRSWIVDFSAYDHFAQPRGFLILAARLQRMGYDVHYLDCLRRKQSDVSRTRPGGPYRHQEIPKPEVLANVPRIYKRYGISTDAFHATLETLPEPAAVLVTTGMTYWYPGVSDTIREIRKRNAKVPIATGGIYATLCPDHAAQHSGADRIFPGEISPAFFDWLESVTGVPKDLTGNPVPIDIPDWTLVPGLSYAVICSSFGCRHQCRYCATDRFFPGFRSRAHHTLKREIESILKIGSISDIALYDDDFADPEHLLNFLKFLAENHYPVRWHLPNALSIHTVNNTIATLMKQTGFVQPRLSVNHLDQHLNHLGFTPTILHRFTSASDSLLQAGYDPAQISAYILAGLPGQVLSGLKNAAEQLLERSITPYFSQFSPIPGTPLGDFRLKSLGYSHIGELLLTNKLLSVYRHPGWHWREYYDLVSELRNPNKETRSGMAS